MNDKNIDNANAGLLPKIWGPPMWESLHCVTFAYPTQPTAFDKQNYRKFFEAIGNILPCCYCSKSYSEFIQSDDTVLTDDVFVNRHNLTHWLYRLHNRVNKKLGTIYNVTYEIICQKYESYRAVCDITPEQKAIAYKNSTLKIVPYISYEIALCFSKYAKKRGIYDFDAVLLRSSKLIRDTDIWYKHNKEVSVILKQMRFSAITGTEREGKYKGYPSLYELELIKRMSTSMSEQEILQIISKMGFKTIDTYEFVK